MFGYAHLPVYRFVDRDMFMRYRGGGIGHKYMRAIEQVYENMSRERIHHKQAKRSSTRSEVPADADDTDSGGEGEGEPTGPQTNQPGGQGGSDTADGDDDGDDGNNTRRDDDGDDDGNNNGNNNGDDGDDNDDDGDNILDSDLWSSGVSDSDDLDSDKNCADYDSHGLADP